MREILKRSLSVRLLSFPAASLCLLSLLSVLELLASDPGASPRVVSIALDGVKVQVPTGHGLKVPNGVRDLRFQFELPGQPGAVGRLRYRLEGFEEEWHDPPSQMRATLHFLDDKRNLVGTSVCLFTGASPGWSGAVESSRFQARSLNAVAPPLARHCFLEIVSGGPETTLGAYAFQDVAFEIKNEPTRVQGVAIQASAGSDTSYPKQDPTAWLREGTKSEMAMVLKTPEPALVLNDTDSTTYCAWRMAPEQWVSVNPGDPIRVSWQECFSIGAGGPVTAKYQYLRPGPYRFQMVALTSLGVPVGPPSQLSFVVRGPTWQEPWFLALVAGSVIAGTWLASRHLMKVRMEKKLAAIERGRALESERARIARDIHDDLGSGLAQIAMLAELAANHSSDTLEWQTDLAEIQERSRNAGRKLDEIVWAINPAYDSVEDLIGYLARFSQDYLRVANIRFRVDVSDDLTDLTLSAAQRHHLYLAAKECIHNAVKHAHAAQVILWARIEQNCLILRIIDDGVGFVDCAAAHYTRGSAGMVTRLTEIGGAFTRDTKPAGGTTVTFRLPLTEPKKNNE